MKTLYINIDSTATSSNEYVEVINYSLCDDFYFHIGEKIAGEYADETNLISLIADFNTAENNDAFAEIVNQWKEIKSILFGDNPHGEYEFILPKTYLPWLRYHTNEVYHKIFRSYFADKPTAAITLNIEELYNDVVPWMRRELLCTIDKNEIYQNRNWLVLADETITKRIPLMDEMAKRYKVYVITKTQWSKLVEKENHRNQVKNAWFCYENSIVSEGYKLLESRLRNTLRNIIVWHKAHVSYFSSSSINELPYLRKNLGKVIVPDASERIDYIKKYTVDAVKVIVFIINLLNSRLAERCNGKRYQINNSKIEANLSLFEIVEGIRSNQIYMLDSYWDIEKFLDSLTADNKNVLKILIGADSREEILRWAIDLSRLNIFLNPKVVEEEYNKRLKLVIEEIVCEARNLNQTHYYRNVTIK